MASRCAYLGRWVLDCIRGNLQMTILTPDGINTTLFPGGATHVAVATDVVTLVNSLSGLAIQAARTANITLALTDKGTLIPMNVGSACTVTVPPNSSVAFDIGTVIGIRWTGAGQPTWVAGAGVTLNTCSPDTLVLKALNARAFAHKIDTDSWDVFGQLV